MYETSIPFIQVNENGVISFNKAWRYSYPDRFPTEFFYTRDTLAVAPFWSDNDIRRDGNVRFATYCDKPDQELCTVSEEGRNALDSVNAYIKEVSGPDDETFFGDWILIAHWENVHPSPHGDINPPPGIPQDDLEKVRKVETHYY